MGTDLFTSHRGAGLIGTLIALLVLGGFSLLFFLVTEEGPTGPSIKTVIKKDARRIEVLEAREETLRAELDATADFGAISREADRLETRLKLAKQETARLGEEKAEAADEIDPAMAALEDYKQSYRKSARASMVGETMDQLKTITGETFDKVKITEIDPVRMQIRHSKGITGVPLEELPTEMQDYLQVDLEEKAARLAKERENRRRINRISGLASLENLLERLERQRNREIASKEADEKTLRNNTNAVPILRGRVQDKRNELQANVRKSRTGGISKAPQIREQISGLENRLQRARDSLPVLKANIRKHESKIDELNNRIEEERDRLREKITAAREEKQDEPSGDQN